MKKAKNSKSDKKKKKVQKPNWGSIVQKKLMINGLQYDQFNTVHAQAYIPPMDAPAYSGNPAQSFRD